MAASRGWSEIREALAGEWFDRYARAGFAAKGVTFGAVGLLMARVARGQRGERADFAGAMQELSEHPALAILLVVLAFGMLGYAAWRILEGVADVEGEGSDLVGLAKRTAYVAVGFLYAGFAVYAFSILMGWGSDEEGVVRDITAEVIVWPGGRWLIGLVGLGVLGAGLAELWFALSGRFQVELGRDDIGKIERWGILATGALGHTGRALVYGAAGVFAIRAAREFDPEEARGVAETVRELATQPYGPLITGFAAAGFVAYGVYNCLLALHHHLPNEGLMRGRGSAVSREERDVVEAD